MNRREVLQSIGAIALASGSHGVAVAAEDRPAAFYVLELQSYLPGEGRAEIRQQWAELFGGQPPAPLVVLNPGMELKVAYKEQA